MKSWILLSTFFFASVAGFCQDSPAKKNATAFPEPFETAPSTPTAKKREPSEFVKEAARRLETSLESLAKLEKDGFGRGEILRFTLIAQKSSKPWDDLVKERKKGAPLRKMAEAEKLDYNEIFLRSEKMRDEIMDKIGPDVIKKDELPTDGAPFQ